MGRISEDNYAKVGSTYNPNTSDLFVLETTNGTRTISSDRVVNPYSKTELEAFFAAKQDSNGAFKYVVDDENHTGIDNPEFDTIYLSKLSSGVYDYAKVFAVKVPGAQMIWEYAFYAYSGKMKQRTRTNGIWGSWLPIGVSDNINRDAIITDHIHNGAVTLLKLGSDVMETGVVNTYIVEGGEGSMYTVLGEYVLIGGKCILSVEAKCTASEALNRFALPVPASRNTYTIVTASWPSAATNPKIFYIRTDGSECYIRASDGLALNRSSVSFTLIYSYDPNA